MRRKWRTRPAVPRGQSIPRPMHMCAHLARAGVGLDGERAALNDLRHRHALDVGRVMDAHVWQTHLYANWHEFGTCEGERPGSPGEACADRDRRSGCITSMVNTTVQTSATAVRKDVGACVRVPPFASRRRNDALVHTGAHRQAVVDAQLLEWTALCFRCGSWRGVRGRLVFRDRSCSGSAPRAGTPYTAAKFTQTYRALCMVCSPAWTATQAACA